MDAGVCCFCFRIHHQWLPDELRVEPFGLDVATIQEPPSDTILKSDVALGNANAIIVTADGKLEGAADPCGEGSPVVSIYLPSSKVNV